jgi:hypothetical protein
VGGPKNYAGVGPCRGGGRAKLHPGGAGGGGGGLSIAYRETRSAGVRGALPYACPVLEGLALCCKQALLSAAELADGTHRWGQPC